jgi:glutamyl-tRNA reductase
MRESDVVIAATSSAEPVLGGDDVKNLMKARSQRPLLLIDLGVPRNIDPAVTGLDNVFLYNIDDLAALARQGIQARQHELAVCHEIVDVQVAELIEKLNAENERLLTADRKNRLLPTDAVSKILLPAA